MEYIVYIDRMSLQKKTTKENYQKILGPKPWPWEEEGLLSGSTKR